ncbi:ABC transporter ATP-binding protein [Halobacteriovorax vibrionivorans]|uniref:ABC transporter ATP-binding protein n=1 Tax=Halobacteriovorax vibrionivorans TaxID=2152716 RepID=A0ABY0IJQ4_9BACT|nr:MULTISPECIES: ABC transporter ATP-binding protein [Halobacteriovorax]RZF23186.1 ABC transporter ATP-binding protein [Halobacteriovorax vibrionivorans]TGD46339.1 ABC transporter ATP-binding protein [Halobacteriovorax sp. Y22]
MLTCKDISKSFKKDFWSKNFVAIRDVSFSLEPGRIVGFLGANGAGKTTLIKIILGFIKPDTGSVEVLGIDWNDESIRKLIGYMPERPFYYQNLTGYEFLDYCGKLQGVSEEKIKENTKKWASKLEIEFALDRKIKGYSKGMLQRLGFVSALIHEPRLIILDEPLSGLDPIGRKEFKEVIRDVNAHGVGVFFSSHIVSDVQEVCDDVVVLENGEIIYNGSIQDLIEKNTDSIYNLTYRLEGQIHNIEIETNSKESRLKSILEKGGEVIKLEKNLSSLEEIVYRLNK